VNERILVKQKKLNDARPVEAASEAPLSKRESALLLGALFALAASLASFTTL
jgi:hypothetical protein